MPMASRSTTTPGPTSLSSEILPISCPFVTKCSGASRCVPTCSVDEINCPPTFSKAGRLIHLTVGPSEVANDGVFTSQFCDRSITRMLLRSMGFMGSPSLISFIFDSAKNNLVDQLFDRSAIIGKIDSTRMLLTYVAVDNAFPSYILEQWIWQTASIYHEIVE